MQTRHQVDRSLWFDPRSGPTPPTKPIEAVNAAQIAPANPPVEQVSREPYESTVELAEAVNLAIGLGRPLLLQGDPGAGKTRLAYAVAYHFGLPLERAYIKSTSRGRDLLYTYDAVRRLYEAQVNRPRRGGDVTDPGRYVRFGALGRAIVRAVYGRRSVLLIDEIDKADLDFPNDLLRELDELAFEVEEAPQLNFAVPPDRPDLRPIIIVTNNEEKTLPAAFLRRCIFHYVEFPDSTKQLDRILALHHIVHPELRERTIEVLLQLRKLDLVKPPGLSELLDWAGFLQHIQLPPDQASHLPYIGALLKQRSDQLRALNRSTTP